MKEKPAQFQLAQIVNMLNSESHWKIDINLNLKKRIHLTKRHFPRKQKIMRNEFIKFNI